MPSVFVIENILIALILHFNLLHDVVEEIIFEWNNILVHAIQLLVLENSIYFLFVFLMVGAPWQVVLDFDGLGKLMLVIFHW